MFLANLLIPIAVLHGFQDAQTGPVQMPVTGYDDKLIAEKTAAPFVSAAEPLPKAALHRLGTLRYRPADGAALSPDGKYLVIQRAKEVRLLDAATGLPAGRFPIDVGSLTSFAFSPDNRTLAVIHSDSVSFREIPSGRLLRVCRPPQNLEGSWLASTTFSADGKLFAVVDFSKKTASQHSFYVWEVATGEAFGPFHGPANYHRLTALSPDGRTLAVWGYNAPKKAGAMATPAQVVQLWDVPTGKTLRRFDVQHGNNSSAAFSPDGKVVAFADGLGTVHLWEIPAGKDLPGLVGRWGLGAFLTYSPDGKRLAAADWFGNFQMWNVASGQRLAATRSPAYRLVGLAFAGDRIIARGVDHAALVLWDPVTGQVLSPNEGHTNAVDSVRFAPDGKSVYSAGSDGKICQWDVATGKQVRHFYRGAADGLSRFSYFKPAELSPDGRYLAADWQPQAAPAEPLDNTGSTHLRLWDLSTGNVTADIKGFSISYHSGYAFSSDGALLIGPAANTNREHDLVICDVETGRQVRKVKIPEMEHRDGSSITLSAGGKLAALSYGTRMIGHGWEAWELLLWRTNEAKALCRLRRRGEQQSFVPAFSPSGKMLAAGGLGEILLVDTDTGQPLRTLKGFVGGVSCLAFSPDGRRLAAGVYPRQEGQVPPLDGDCQVHVWDIEAEKTIGRYEGHRRAIRSLAYSPDGGLLASGSLDTTILVWDLARRPGPPRSRPSKP